MVKIKNVYIHIPFCRRKCNYCTFSSYSEPELIEDYLTALEKEIQSGYNNEKIETLYIGGGTPSLLKSLQIARIASLFNCENNAEITCEANPENLSLDWLKGIFDAGVNRISFGVQSFDDNLLKIIGRNHTVKDAFNAVSNARKAGFNNISIDLIYGLPGQEISDVSASVITACELQIPHISTYGLKIEEGSRFSKMHINNLPDEDIQADMYLKICSILEQYGFKHYEISNFAKDGYFSEHNLNYWKANGYYGFGTAACGYDGKYRYSHDKTISGYINSSTVLTEVTELSRQEKLEEKIFLGLRTCEGINLEDINRDFHIDFEKKYSDILKKYDRYFISKNGNLSFNNEGFLISNYILSDFLE